MLQISSLKLCVQHLLEFPNEIFRFSRIQFECLRQCMEISFQKYWDICGNNYKKKNFAFSLFSKAWMALRLSSVSNALINLDMFCINLGKFRTELRTKYKKSYVNLISISKSDKFPLNKRFTVCTKRRYFRTKKMA